MRNPLYYLYMLTPFVVHRSETQAPLVVVEVEQVESPRRKERYALDVRVAMYLNAQFFSIFHNSWQSFREMQIEIAETSNAQHEQRSRRHQELEAMRYESLRLTQRQAGHIKMVDNPQFSRPI